MFYAPLPRNLEAAFRDAKDTKPAVRASAMKDLVAHAEAHRARVLEALAEGLVDATPPVRAAAAEALGDVGGKEHLAALLVAIEDADQLVRQRVILALGELGDPRAQQRLERALEDARPEVRFQAVMAYPRVATARKDAERAIIRATRDEDDHVVHVAFRMAEELAEEGEVSPAILDRARACLRHDAVRVRVVAAVVLAQSGDPAGDDVITDVVLGRLKSEEPEDLAAAIDLAGVRKLASCEQALERRAFGGFFSFVRDPYRWHARVALAHMGHARARAEILEELGSLSYERRTLAVSAAGKARLGDAAARIRAMKDRPERADPGAVEAALALLGEAEEA